MKKSHSHITRQSDTRQSGISPRPLKLSRLSRLSLLAGLGAALLAGCNLRGGDSISQSNQAMPTAAPIVETINTKDAVAMQNAFAEVARVVEPAVVTIVTERRAQSSPAPGAAPDPFEEFFRRFREFQPNSWPQTDNGPRLLPVQENGGLGSGFIYRKDGLIVTNAHVVQGADVVNVKLSDGREFDDAKVIGQDARSDIAVVKINAKNLPTVAAGDSSQVRVGDWAIAVGNPFGLEHTLTVGVISAKSREVPINMTSPQNYLQTDASINPGNSGGPLLDIYGRAIGVNTAIFSQTGSSIGIGFAIPINTAREIADILVKQGRVRRARLGVGINELGKRAQALGLPAGTEGVLVESVSPNSPASRAGLQVGDVVLELNGQRVKTPLELQQLVSRSPIDSQAKLKVLRGEQTLNLSAKLEELKEGEAAQLPAPSAPEPEQTAGPLGLKLTPLTPQLARQFGISGGQGVVITGVDPDSPATEAELQVGDVIERVGRVSVTTPADVKKQVADLLSRQSGGDKSVALYINRAGERRFVIVNVG